MRILHIHSGNLYGGVESMLGALARARVPRHEPVFALTHEGRIARELRHAGCEVHMLGATRARNPWAVWRARNALAACSRGPRFDATIAHSAWSLAVLGPSAPRPLVLYQHDAIERPDWICRAALRARPDLVLANSRFTARGAAAFYPGAPIRVIYPCAELAGTSAPLAPRAETRAVILQAARFEEWKGHALLLDALGLLRDNPDWVLWIAGGAQRPHEAALRDRLERQARSLGLAERTVFLGHRSDMPALMRRADIYCQPNTRPEPFGLTFIEALDAGLAVVATGLGGDREILSPQWGALPSAEPRAVASALEKCIAEVRSGATRANGGPERARELCEPQQHTKRLERAIAELALRRAAA